MPELGGQKSTLLEAASGWSAEEGDGSRAGSSPSAPALLVFPEGAGARLKGGRGGAAGDGGACPSVPRAGGVGGSTAAGASGWRSLHVQEGRTLKD